MPSVSILRLPSPGKCKGTAGNKYKNNYWMLSICRSCSTSSWPPRPDGKHLEIFLPKAEKLLLGLWIRAVLAAPPFSLFSVSFSLPIFPLSSRWTGFKKGKFKAPAWKAICGRRWAQLWSADFFFFFFASGESQMCWRIFCVPVCLSIDIYVCVYKD